jgi:hypothetical protein
MWWNVKNKKPFFFHGLPTAQRYDRVMNMFYDFSRHVGTLRQNWLTQGDAKKFTDRLAGGGTFPDDPDYAAFHVARSLLVYIHTMRDVQIKALADEIVKLREAMDKVSERLRKTVVETGGTPEEQMELLQRFYVEPPGRAASVFLTGRLHVDERVLAAMFTAMTYFQTPLLVGRLGKLTLAAITHAPRAAGLQAAYARLVAAVMASNELVFPRQTYHTTMMHSAAPFHTHAAVQALRVYRYDATRRLLWRDGVSKPFGPIEATD